MTNLYVIVTLTPRAEHPASQPCTAACTLRSPPRLLLPPPPHATRARPSFLLGNALPTPAPCPLPPSNLGSFRLGRQEDAHEFLIALLDAMHEASIAGVSPKPAPELAQTSFVYRIFGGRMRSQVRWPRRAVALCPALLCSAPGCCVALAAACGRMGAVPARLAHRPPAVLTAAAASHRALLPLRRSSAASADTSPTPLTPAST